MHNRSRWHGGYQCFGMRISDAPFLQGLAAIDRQHIVNQAVGEQGRSIDELVRDVFRASEQAVKDTIRPLTYWANIAFDNKRDPASTPLDFWANLETQQNRFREIDRHTPLNPAGTRVGSPKAITTKPLSPLEMAQGGPAGARSPRIGVPPPVKIPQFDVREVLSIRSEVTSPIGRLVDVFA